VTDLLGQNKRNAEKKRDEAREYFYKMCEQFALDPNAECNPELRHIKQALADNKELEEFKAFFENYDPDKTEQVMLWLSQADMKGLPEAIREQAMTLVTCGIKYVAGDKWRPIETAPKDGRQIIIADFTIGRRHQVIASWNGLKGCWCTVRQSLGQFLDYSHWQPLPNPPTSEQTDLSTDNC